MSNYNEIILSAMLSVADAAVKKLNYDETIIALVHSIEDAAAGKYMVRYQGNLFVAWNKNPDTAYEIGSNVYVTIPLGDYSNVKLILSYADDNKSVLLNHYRHTVEPTWAANLCLGLNNLSTESMRILKIIESLRLLGNSNITLDFVTDIFTFLEGWRSTIISRDINTLSEVNNKELLDAQFELNLGQAINNWLDKIKDNQEFYDIYNNFYGCLYINPAYSFDYIREWIETWMSNNPQQNEYYLNCWEKWLLLFNYIIKTHFYILDGILYILDGDIKDKYYALKNLNQFTDYLGKYDTIYCKANILTNFEKEILIGEDKLYGSFNYMNAQDRYGIELFFEGIDNLSYKLDGNSFDGTYPDYDIPTSQEIDFKIDRRALKFLKYIFVYAIPVSSGASGKLVRENYLDSSIQDITETAISIDSETLGYEIGQDNKLIFHKNAQGIISDINVTDIRLDFIEYIDLENLGYYPIIETMTGNDTNISNVVLKGKLYYKGAQIGETECKYQWYVLDMSAAQVDNEIGAGWSALEGQQGPTLTISKGSAPNKYLLKFTHNKEIVPITYTTVNTNYHYTISLKCINNNLILTVKNEDYGYTTSYYDQYNKLKSDYITLLNTVDAENKMNELIDNSIIENWQNAVNSVWYCRMADGTVQELPLNFDIQQKGEVINVKTINDKLEEPVIELGTLGHSLIIPMKNLTVKTSYIWKDNNGNWAEYTVSSPEDEADVTVEFDGLDSFKYNTQGILSLNEESNKDKVVTANIMWKYGKGINYNLKWYINNIPIELEGTLDVPNTMFTNVYVDKINSNLLHYQVRQLYRTDYVANNIITLLILTSDLLTYNFTKPIVFMKDGEQGTNGTAYTCLVVQVPVDDEEEKNGQSPYIPVTCHSNLYNQFALRVNVFEKGEKLALIDLDVITWSIKSGAEAVTIKTETVNQEKCIFTLFPQLNGIPVSVLTFNEPIIILAEVRLHKRSDGEHILYYNFPLIYSLYYKDVSNPGSPIPFYYQDLLHNVPQFIKYASNGYYSSYSLDDLNIVSEGKYCSDIYPSNINSSDLIQINTLEDNGVKKYKLTPNEYYFISKGQPSITAYWGENKTVTFTEKNNTTNSIEYKLGIVFSLVCYLDPYGNEAINGWDGLGIELNDEYGSLLAPLVGAGIKDKENRFSGIVLGLLQKTRSAYEEALGIEKSDEYVPGLYSFNQGINTGGITQNGDAYFGQGKLIEIKGDLGVISGNGGSSPAALIKARQKRKNEKTSDITISYPTDTDIKNGKVHYGMNLSLFLKNKTVEDNIEWFDFYKFHPEKDESGKWVYSLDDIKGISMGWNPDKEDPFTEQKGLNRFFVTYGGFLYAEHGKIGGWRMEDTYLTNNDNYSENVILGYTIGDFFNNIYNNKDNGFLNYINNNRGELQKYDFETIMSYIVYNSIYNNGMPDAIKITTTNEYTVTPLEACGRFISFCLWLREKVNNPDKLETNNPNEIKEISANLHDYTTYLEIGTKATKQEGKVAYEKLMKLKGKTLTTTKVDRAFSTNFGNEYDNLFLNIFNTSELKELISGLFNNDDIDFALIAEYIYDNKKYQDYVKDGKAIGSRMSFLHLLHFLREHKMRYKENLPNILSVEEELTEIDENLEDEKVELTKEEQDNIEAAKEEAKKKKEELENKIKDIIDSNNTFFTTTLPENTVSEVSEDVDLAITVIQNKLLSLIRFMEVDAIDSFLPGSSNEKQITNLLTLYETYVKSSGSFNEILTGQKNELYYKATDDYNSFVFPVDDFTTLSSKYGILTNRFWIYSGGAFLGRIGEVKGANDTSITRNFGISTLGASSLNNSLNNVPNNDNEVLGYSIILESAGNIALRTKSNDGLFDNKGSIYLEAGSVVIGNMGADELNSTRTIRCYIPPENQYGIYARFAPDSYAQLPDDTEIKSSSVYFRSPSGVAGVNSGDSTYYNDSIKNIDGLNWVTGEFAASHYGNSAKDDNGMCGWSGCLFATYTGQNAKYTDFNGHSIPGCHVAVPMSFRNPSNSTLYGGALNGGYGTVLCLRNPLNGKTCVAVVADCGNFGYNPDNSANRYPTINIGGKQVTRALDLAPNTYRALGSQDGYIEFAVLGHVESWDGRQLTLEEFVQIQNS